MTDVDFTVDDPKDVQGSQAWLDRRKNFLGASEASAVKRLSPYITPLMVFNDKLGLETREVDTYIMERGNRLEPFVRDKYNQIHGTNMQPAVFEKDFFIASLDGHDPAKKGAIEIKLCGKKVHNLNCDGEVVDYYFAQLVHQFHVVDGLDWIDFVTYYIPPETDEDEGIITTTRVERSTIKKDLKTYLKEASDFWKNHVLAKVPPPPTKLDFKGVNDKRLNALLKTFTHVQEMKGSIENLEQQVANQMIELGKQEDWGPMFRVKDLGFQWVVPPGKKKGFWSIERIEG